VVTAYLLLAPATLLLLAVLAYPVAWEAWASVSALSSRSDARGFVGLANYRAMLAEPFFWKALVTTALYFVVNTAAKLVLGLGMALLLWAIAG
jgi:multiple sugar transport system permease protein